MQITLTGIGKKFSNEWIFRDVSFVFPERSVSAILGRNGSGKSTLLQIVSGNLTPTAGKISYNLDGNSVHPESVFRHLSMAAPYLELIEEFTLEEMVKFHFSFKKFIPGVDFRVLKELLGFGNVRHKHISQFSSGMKQRVKLSLALLSDVPLILLDEPTMNLDQEGIAWYLELIRQYTANRTIIICTNLHQTESAFAGSILHVEDFKS